MDGRLVEDDDLSPEVQAQLAREPARGQFARLADKVAPVRGQLLFLAGIVRDEDEAGIGSGADLVEFSIVDDRRFYGVVTVAAVDPQSFLQFRQPGSPGAHVRDEGFELFAHLDENSVIFGVHPGEHARSRHGKQVPVCAISPPTPALASSPHTSANPRTAPRVAAYDAYSRRFPFRRLRRYSPPNEDFLSRHPRRHYASLRLLSFRRRVATRASRRVARSCRTGRCWNPRAPHARRPKPS